MTSREGGSRGRPSPSTARPWPDPSARHRHWSVDIRDIPAGLAIFRRCTSRQDRPSGPPCRRKEHNERHHEQQAPAHSRLLSVRHACTLNPEPRLPHVPVALAVPRPSGGTESNPSLRHTPRDHCRVPSAPQGRASPVNHCHDSSSFCARRAKGCRRPPVRVGHCSAIGSSHLRATARQSTRRWPSAPRGFPCAEPRVLLVRHQVPSRSLRTSPATSPGGPAGSRQNGHRESQSWPGGQRLTTARQRNITQVGTLVRGTDHHGVVFLAVR